MVSCHHQTRGDYSNFQCCFAIQANNHATQASQSDILLCSWKLFCRNQVLQFFLRQYMHLPPCPIGSQAKHAQPTATMSKDNELTVQWVGLDKRCE